MYKQITVTYFNIRFYRIGFNRYKNRAEGATADEGIGESGSQ